MKKTTRGAVQCTDIEGCAVLHWIANGMRGGFVEFLILEGFVSSMVATLLPVVIPYICPDPATFGTRIVMAYGITGIGVLVGNPIALLLTYTPEGHFLGAHLWMGICALVGVAFFTHPVRAAKRNRLKGIGHHA